MDPGDRALHRGEVSGELQAQLLFRRVPEQRGHQPGDADYAPIFLSGALALWLPSKNKYLERYSYSPIHPQPEHLPRSVVHVLRDQGAPEGRIAAFQRLNLSPQKLRDPARDPRGGVAR